MQDGIAYRWQIMDRPDRRAVAEHDEKIHIFDTSQS